MSVDGFQRDEFERDVEGVDVTDISAIVDGDGDVVVDDDPGKFNCFEGDEGALSEVERRALVVLLKNRFITGRSHSKEYATIAAKPAGIRSHLHDQFQELVLHRAHEVAYKRPVVAPAGGKPFPTLLHDLAWKREETVLLVFLRTKFRAEQAAGAVRVFVDRDEMVGFLAEHRPSGANDRVADLRSTRNAIDALYQAGLLVGRSDADRLEIEPAIEVLLPQPKLLELLVWLQGQNVNRGIPTLVDVAPVVDASDLDETPDSEVDL